MQPDEIPSDLITVKEAAALAHGTHVGTVRRWIFAGKLPAYRLAGSRYLVSRADVLNLIQPNVVHKPMQPPTRREMTQRERETDEILRKAGVR